MYVQIINSNANESNLSEDDIRLFYPERLVDNDGIQYPLSVLTKFSNEQIYNLFGLRQMINNHLYNESDFDDEIHEKVLSHYDVSSDNNYIRKNWKKQDKPQEIIDEVKAKREFEASIEYRKQRKEAYIREISPEEDAISTLGDVVDALYQAIYFGETDKLNELSTIIERIKEIYPKPSANTA